MMHTDERSSSERLGLLAAFVASVAIVGVALYFILHQAAPMTASVKHSQAKSTLPAPAPIPTVTAPEPERWETSKDGVYRCIVNGTTTYSTAPCTGGKLVDVTPASSGFTPERTRSATTSVAVVQPDASAGQEQADVGAKRAARCAWLLAEIERLDAMARQPQTASTQDWLREERRKLVDQRYDLKC